MKKAIKRIAVIAAVLLLLFACLSFVAAEGQTVNILLIVGEDASGTFRPMAPFILTLDLATQTVRIINFYRNTQIVAVTREAGEMSISMNLLSHCEFDEIVKAFENTFGITIDRHLFISYQYGSFDPMAAALDMLCPVTLDIPEILLGDKEYTTVNGNMPWVAEELGRRYTPITGAEDQQLDTVGFLSYFIAEPTINISTVDWETFYLDSYQLWDTKCQASLEALIPNAEKLNAEAAQTFWNLIMQDQETDITQDDIAAWSQVSFSFGQDPYLSVPGVENAQAVEFDASAITSQSLVPYFMVAYENSAAAVQAFVNGE